MKIDFSESDLRFDGQKGLLYGGEFQYFRIPADFWENSLRLLKEAHVNFISCYIPWIWHEPSEGHYDFTGESAPERDLVRFLSLVEAQDFALIVRPGPYVYGEYQGFGLPEWLREKHPEILIQYEVGQSKEISLNHPTYLSYVKKWLQEVRRVLEPWYANDRIIATQIDNETGLPQFGGVAYCGDLNPHTIETYHAYLKKRFQTIEHLNIIWDTQFQTFSEILPPKKVQFSAVQFRQWAEFIEDYIVDHIVTLKQYFEELGYPGLYYLNDPYLCQWPNHSPKKSKHALVGFDIYSKFTTDTTAVHDVPFGISFAPEFYRSINGEDKIQMGVEVGSGWFDPRVVVQPKATEQKVMSSLVRGVKVLNYYLLHDCVEESGVPWVFQSPLDKDGQPVPRYQVVQNMGEFAQKHGAVLADTEPLHNAVGLLKYIPQGWDFLKANFSVWNAFEKIDQALAHFSGLTGVFGALSEGGYSPLVHDLESISKSTMDELKVIFFASTPQMDSEAYQKLYYFVQNGGTLVSFGAPAVTNIRGEPYRRNPLYPARRVDQNFRVQYGTNFTLSQVALDMMDYQMMRRSHPHKLSLHTLDMMHPFVEFTKYIGTVGTWLQTDRDERFWASRFTTCWQGGSGIQPLLMDAQGRIVAYSQRVGRGKSIFLGTIPGLFFDTPGYYQIEDEKKQSVIHFLSGILQEAGIWPLVDPIPHVEVILRQTSDNEVIMALINRKGAQDVNFHLNLMNPYTELETLYTSSQKDEIHALRYQRFQGYLDDNSIYVGRLRK